MASQSLNAGPSPCSAQAEQLSLQGGGSHAAGIAWPAVLNLQREACAYVACRPSDTELNPHGSTVVGDLSSMRATTDVGS